MPGQFAPKNLQSLEMLSRNAQNFVDTDMRNAAMQAGLERQNAIRKQGLSILSGLDEELKNPQNTHKERNYARTKAATSLMMLGMKDEGVGILGTVEKPQRSIFMSGQNLAQYDEDTGQVKILQSAPEKEHDIVRNINGIDTPMKVRQSELTPGDKPYDVYKQSEADKRAKEAQDAAAKRQREKPDKTLQGEEAAYNASKGDIQKQFPGIDIDKFENYTLTDAEARAFYRNLPGKGDKEQLAAFRKMQHQHNSKKSKYEENKKIKGGGAPTGKATPQPTQDANAFTIQEIRASYPHLTNKTDQQIIDAYKKQGITVTP